VNRLWIDCETCSPTPIKHGHYRYAVDAEGMIVTWAVGNAPVQAWDRMAEPKPPATLVQAMLECTEAWAQNAAFDRHLLRTAFPELPEIPLHKWRCMMVRAYMHGLPGKLEKLSEIFRLGAQAKYDGLNFIQMFCTRRKDQAEWNTRLTHPLEWSLFLDYAEQDIVAMRALDVKIPKWNATPQEWHLWHLDQERNDRGFAVDVDLAQACLRAVTKEQKRMADRTQEMTDDEVLRPTQRDKLLVWILEQHDVLLPDLKADTIERRLQDENLPDAVKELLRLRLRASKASSSKYKRVIDCHIKGRLHGTIQFGGAQRTLRDAGRIFQPQNLARFDVDAAKEWYDLGPGEKLTEEMTADYIAAALDAFMSDCTPMVFGDGLMSAAGNVLRGVIVAGPNLKLVIADLANIEGRGLAWMAREGWKLAAFRAYDDGTGKDLYILAYARAFNISPDVVDKEMRQIGKVMELALGYQGGVGAFCTMAVTYGLDLDKLADSAWSSIPEWEISAAKAKRDRALLRNDVAARTLSEKVYVVCSALVALWREAHPATTQFWQDVDWAAKAALLNPGKAYKAGPLVFDKQGNWLRMRLPSGRFLCYPDPRIEQTKLGEVITFAGVNPYTRQWCRIRTYAGKLVENADQAMSRDVLKHGEDLADQCGYPVVLPVHDELVTECPDTDDYNVEGLAAIMATVPAWAEGLPLAAAGFETKRYRKQ
jgi:DNA polymerase